MALSWPAHSSGASALQQQRQCVASLTSRPAVSACPSRIPGRRQTPTAAAAGHSSSSAQGGTVERWMDVLRSLGGEDSANAGAAAPSCARLLAQRQAQLRGHLQDLLIAHPEAVRLPPEDVAGVARTLYEATAQQRLYTQWWWPADVVVELAVTWGPDGLTRALAALQRAAEASFDGLVNAGDLLAACAPHVQPLLAPNAPEALTRKARLLKERVPEFTPGTVLRACPELLLSWQEWEIETGVVRAGDVVVLGQEAHLTAELILTPQHAGQQAPPALSQPQQHQQHSQQQHQQQQQQQGDAPAPGSTRRVMRRRWDADSLAQRDLPGSCVQLAIVHHDDHQHHHAPADASAGAPPQGQPQPPDHDKEVLCVLTNSRQLIYVCDRLVEVRFMDPFRQEEALLAAGGPRFAASQCYTPRSWLLWPGGAAAAGGATAAAGGGVRSTATAAPPAGASSISATAPTQQNNSGTGGKKKCMFAPVTH